MPVLVIGGGVLFFLGRLSVISHAFGVLTGLALMALGAFTGVAGASRESGDPVRTLTAFASSVDRRLPGTVAIWTRTTLWLTLRARSA
jgi:hypothetical protein